MKRYYYLLFSLLVAFAFSQCEKYSGDYDLEELPELWIDTTGATVNFTAKQYVDSLIINPTVIYTGNDSLAYYWIRSNRPHADLPADDDTISTEKNLNIRVTFPVSPGTYDSDYYLIFQVKEMSTGNAAVFPYRLKVQNPFATGLLIAHERDGTADFDFIEAPTTANSVHYHNLHETITDRRLPGTPVSIGSMGTRTFVLFSTDEAISLLSYNSLTLRFSDRDAFSLNPGQVKPQGGTEFFVNDGKLYISTSGSLLALKGTMSDYSDYSLFPTTKVSYSFTYFDELGGRWARLQSATGIMTPLTSADSGRRFSLDNIQNRKLLFSEDGFVLSNLWYHNTHYAVFQDKTTSAKYLYIFNGQTPATPDYALMDLNSAVDMQQAIAYATITSAPVLYYATSSKVYLLQLNAGGNTFVQAGAQFTAPAGEEITCVFTASNTITYIATYHAGEGRATLYQVGVNSGTGVYQTTPLKSWIGIDGRITKMGLKRS